MALNDQPQLKDLFPEAPAADLERVLQQQALAAHGRFVVLKSFIAPIAATSGAVHELSRLVGMGWPGAASAKAMINAFETFFNWPESSRAGQLLLEQSKGTRDTDIIQQWLEFYRASRREYGKFARHANNRIGEKVFGEYFDA